MRRVGLLMGYREDDAEGQANLAAFRQGLQQLGWIEGRNIQIDIRWGGADPDKARGFAKELVAMSPDVIVPNVEHCAPGQHGSAGPRCVFRVKM